MRMQIAPFIAAILLVSTQNACQVSPCAINKKSFLRSYENFIAEVDKKDLEISSDEWERYDQKFNRFVDDCYQVYEEDLSAEEKKEFWLHTLEYYSLRYGRGIINELSDEEKGELKQLEQHLSESLEVPVQEIQSLLNQNKDEIQNLFENMANDIENWSREWQRIMEEK